MGFFSSKKVLKEEIKQLQQEVKDLKKVVVTNELERLRQANEDYKNQTKLLSNVKFRVKDAKIVKDEENDTRFIRIVYQLPVIEIPLDENGEPLERNDFFFSVNSLEMLDFTSLEKLSNLFDRAKNKKD